MKSLSTFCILALFLSLNTAFAGVERECSTQVLTCKLEKILPTGGRTLISQSATKYDGINDDEPSLPPESCRIVASLNDGTGLSFNVSIDDEDLMVNLFMVKNFSMLPGDAAFKVTAGSSFYYRSGSSLLTCDLSK